MSVKPFTSGSLLLTKNGDPLVLRGFNIRAPVADSDMAWLSQNGYNSIRYVIYWQNVEPQEGVMNWTDLDQIVALCQKYKMFLHLDVHQWRYSPYFTDVGGVGFPAWLLAAKPAPAYPVSSVGRTQFSDDLFLKRDYGAVMWPKFLNFHGKIAQRYLNVPNVVLKEMLNEPLTGATHASNVSLACYDRSKEFVQYIRTIDPFTTIIIHDMLYASQSVFVANCQNALNTHGPMGSNVCWERSYYPKYEGGDSVATIDSKLKTLRDGVNGVFNMPHLISETGIQTTSDTTLGIVNLDLEYRKLLNGGTGAIEDWQYAIGSRDGWMGPRTATGLTSLGVATAKWLQGGVTPFDGTPPPTSFTLTILAPVGQGATTPAPGVASFTSGQNVVVTAAPAVGWVFDHWIIDGVSDGNINPITITMGANHTLQPVFTQTAPTLETLRIHSLLQVPWTVNGTAYQGDHILQFNDGTQAVISAPKQVTT